jgi:hypothetical protein
MHVRAELEERAHGLGPLEERGEPERMEPIVAEGVDR